MGNFNGGKRAPGGWRNDRGGDRGGRGDRDERPTMHPATCAECGRDCQVPFLPNGKKPIFCRDCFKREDDEDSFERPQRERSYDRPSYDEPAFKKSFDRPAAAPDRNKEEFERINFKLDSVMKTLSMLMDQSHTHSEAKAPAKSAPKAPKAPKADMFGDVEEAAPMKKVVRKSKKTE